MRELIQKRLLELPDVSEKEVITKVDFAENPDITVLTPDQLGVFNTAIGKVKLPDTSITLIKGYAGTGKTFLTTIIMEHILSETSLKVAVTAPTNKAVKVLKDKSKFSSKVSNLHFSTIHSLLGLRETIDNRTGKQIFINMRADDVKIGDYNVVFIDEISMLPPNLWKDLVPYLELHDIKLILIGDPVQIPPVGQLESIPFTKEGVKAHNISVNLLTEILRQGKDNPIIDITLKVRSAIGRDIIIPVRQDNYDDSTLDGVYFLGANDSKFFKELLHTYFTSGNFKDNADFMKVIAWTNKAVTSFNLMIRKMIYGPKAPKLCIGEKLIADRPIVSPLDEKVILFNNNDGFEVVKFVREEGKYKGVELVFYIATVRSYDGIEKDIRIIHEDSEDDYKLLLAYFMDTAKNMKRGSWEFTSAWKDYYKCREVFAEVKYNYAITAHKSQGSTYENVVVVESDLDRNYKVVERNRIKYTAFTRPSKKLFVAE